MRDNQRTKDPMKDTWLCSPMIQCQWFAALPVWRRHIEQLLYCSVGCIAHADAGGNRKQTKNSKFHKRQTIGHHIQRVRLPNLNVSQGTRLIIRLICVRALALRLLSTPVCMRRSQLCMALLKVPEGIGQRSTLFGPSMQNVMCKCKKQLWLQYIKEHSALWGQHCPCQRAMHRDLSDAGSSFEQQQVGWSNWLMPTLQAALRI